MISTINPATGETIQTFTPLTTTEIETKLQLADSTFQNYRKSSFESRADKLLKVATILEDDAPEWAKLMTLEMGKPFQSAIAEVHKSALVCRYYAEHGADFLQNRIVETDASHSYVTYQPLGAILAVMPWNFPFWQVFRFAAPTLMAGNVALLKHASNVPQCSLAIATIFKGAGFAKGVFQSLLIESGQVEQVIRDPRVKAVTLTGSELAGQKVASVAGEELKKSVLELGGSDPFIVLEDADLEEAATVAVEARVRNNGQSCIASKRFILVEAIAPKFEQLLLEKFQALKIGDPMAEDTDIGPLATSSILEEIHGQVQKTVSMGAKVLIGGKPLQGKGHFYPPTILTNIPENSPAMSEEFFGPVALLFTVKDVQSAIALANGTSLGLGACVWTKNEKNIERCIQDIEAGAVFINGLVKSDVRLPFGGIKRSGYGRELSIEGIREFVNIKTVWQKV
ncbi:MAG: NAD-dependent succinate-semialdehyde dehydrogenase [Cyanobacterium sp.]